MFVHDRKNRIYLAVLMIFLAIILLINSPFSPIRDINYLDYDSTIFYIMGKGIKYNYTPYVDLTDHKGIYIFLINYLGALICEKHFLGMFIVQFLVFGLSVISIYNLALFVTEDRRVSFLSTLIMIVVESSYYFSQGGIKCETLLMPCLFFTMYLFIKEDWRQSSFSKSMFLIGICAGIVMMTKANMLLSFVPIIIYHLYYFFVDRDIKKIFMLFISGLSGVACGAAPAIIYCLANNNLNEMIYYTFKLNFAYLNDLQYYYRSYFDAAVRLIYHFLPVIIASILSVVAFYKLLKKKKLLLYYIPLVILGLAAIFIAFRPYDYYASVLLPCIFYVVVYICVAFKKFVLDRKKGQMLIYASVFILLFAISYRISWKEIERKQHTLYVISKRMHKMYSDVLEKEGGDSSFLAIGACINIYNELDILPNLRHFCTTHISRKIFSEPYDDILNNINEKKSRFVGVFLTRQMIVDGFSEDVKEALKEAYTFVGDVPGYGAELYRRK